MSTLNKFGFSANSKEIKKLFNSFKLKSSDYNFCLKRVCKGNLSELQNIERKSISREVEFSIIPPTSKSLKELFNASETLVSNELLKLNILEDDIESINLVSNGFEGECGVLLYVNYTETELERDYLDRVLLSKNLINLYPLILLKAESIYESTKKSKELKNDEINKLNLEISKLKNKLHKISNSKS